MSTWSLLVSSILIFSDETPVEAELVTMLSGSSGASVVRNQSRVAIWLRVPQYFFQACRRRVTYLYRLGVQIIAGS